MWTKRLKDIRDENRVKTNTHFAISNQTSQYYIARLDAAVAVKHHYFDGIFIGRGIAICGGGRYFNQAYTAIYTLRQVGCTLPIELWYFAGEEVRCIPNVTYRICEDKIHGWALKCRALTYSNFEETLLLDADNLATRDPSFLFEEEEYKRTGALFWADLTTKIKWVDDKFWTFAKVQDTSGPYTESGQILVNKKKCWRELHVAMQINNDSKFWYKLVKKGGGDKDTYRIAWRRCGSPFYVVEGAYYASPMVVQPDLKGQPLFYHCTQGKREIERGLELVKLPEHLRKCVKDAYIQRTTEKPPWNLSKEAIEEKKQLVKDYSFTDFPPGEGRGIITLAGGKYTVSGYILCSMLRTLGCKLPITVFHIGDLTDIAIKVYEELEDVRCVNLDVTDGWKAKIYALIQSQYQEVLFLDADQFPIRDPEYLFEHPIFKKVGAVFWPDNPINNHITTESFEIVGIPTPGFNRLPNSDKPSDYRPLESGQILIDKGKEITRRAMAFCAFLNSHSDFWYPKNQDKLFRHVYGDNPLFYLAWEKVKAPYHMMRDCSYLGTNDGFLQKDFDGNPLFQHFCNPQAKIQLEGTIFRPSNIKHFDLILKFREVFKQKVSRESLFGTALSSV